MEITKELINFAQLELCLTDLADTIREINLEKGWRGPETPDRSFGDEVALIHSEVSEMLEAFRDFGESEGLYRGSDGEFKADLRNADGTLNKPEGIGPEAADVLIRLLDVCYEYGIDLTQELFDKLTYNASRPIRHGGKNL